MKNEIIIFENQNVKLEVNMKDDTVWLSLEQMAKLFGRDRTVITRHINNIFKDNEFADNAPIESLIISGSPYTGTISKSCGILIVSSTKTKLLSPANVKMTLSPLSVLITSLLFKDVFEGTYNG